MNNKTIQVDLNNCPTEYCECGSPFFRTRNIIKRLPALMIGMPQDQQMNIPILMCERCMKVHASSLTPYPGLKLPMPKTKEEMDAAKEKKPDAVIIPIDLSKKGEVN